MKTNVSDITQIDHRLLKKLRCPACGEGMFQQTYRDVLSCQSCKRPFPITHSIPNLTYFPEGTDEAIAFNNAQAEYERQTHEPVAQSKHERLVRS